MNIAIIHCHTSNRGDEAAVRALVDEMISKYPDVKITLFMMSRDFYPNLPEGVESHLLYGPGNIQSKLFYLICRMTRGKVCIGRTLRCFMKALKDIDIVLHAPGGPSIGDVYYAHEKQYLRRFELIRMMKKPYFFYAPSMGPFHKTKRNPWRIKILEGAEAVVIRDPISAEYVRELMPNLRVYQTLDSALQHDVDLEENKGKFDGYTQLQKFMKQHEKCVGITITDLCWHPLHSQNKEIPQNIQSSFNRFLQKLTAEGYGVVFIPQLYGNHSDYDLMKQYCLNDHFFLVEANDGRYDAYFQQYLISRLYAVIGMRYHSNIFSAKMGIPFISVSYEQKMRGFMKKMDLDNYCIDVSALSEEMLQDKFHMLIDNYEGYKEYLSEKHDEMRDEAYRSTEILNEVICGLGLKGKN